MPLPSKPALLPCSLSWPQHSVSGRLPGGGGRLPPADGGARGPGGRDEGRGGGRAAGAVPRRAHGRGGVCAAGPHAGPGRRGPPGAALPGAPGGCRQGRQASLWDVPLQGMAPLRALHLTVSCGNAVCRAGGRRASAAWSRASCRSVAQPPRQPALQANRLGISWEHFQLPCSSRQRPRHSSHRPGWPELQELAPLQGDPHRLRCTCEVAERGARLMRLGPGGWPAVMLPVLRSLAT